MLPNFESRFQDLSDEALYELTYDEETGCETTAETQDDLPVTRQIRNRLNKARRQAANRRTRQGRNRRKTKRLDTYTHHWELIDGFTEEG